MSKVRSKDFLDAKDYAKMLKVEGDGTGTP